VKEALSNNPESIEDVPTLKQRIRELEQSVAESKRTEEALRESEAKFRFLSENMADVAFIVNMDLRTTYVSPSVERILGFTPEERKTQRAEEQLAPQALQLAFETLAEEIEREKAEDADPDRSRTLALDYYHKDGSVITLETNFRGVRDSKGTLAGFYGLSRDITDRKQADEELRESEESLRSYLENAPDGIYMSDLEGNFLYGNRMCEEITGYRREELIGKNFLELNLLSENSLNEAVRLLQANMEGKPTGPDEIELITKEGRLIPVEVNTSVFQRMGQRVVLASVRDITERKRAEEHLKKSEEKYRTILEDMDEGYFEIDLAGNFTFVNDAECQDLGYSRDELIGMSYRQYSDEATAKKLYELFHDIYNTGKPDKGFHGQFISKDGRQHFNEVSASLIRDANDNPIGFLGISQDVTERKKAEEDLKKTLENLRKSFGVTIQVMVSAIEARDPYTAGHQIRAADLARAIATGMGLPQEKIEGIRMAGSIHDIGKLSIPAEILSKPTKLSDIEFSLIKEHARKGYEMLKNVESHWPLAEIVYQHHERMNGSGYPRNLKGEEILIEARILAVADVAEAMASHRPYRAALGIDAALKEIEDNKGTLYDAKAADACLRLFREKGFNFRGHDFKQ